MTASKQPRCPLCGGRCLPGQTAFDFEADRVGRLLEQPRVARAVVSMLSRWVAAAVRPAGVSK